MRHLKRGRKLNRTASHRKAMLANLAVSILERERVTTTVPKAKEVRRVVERLITYGKRGTVSAIRLAARTVKNKTVLRKLFGEIAPGYSGREGGYLRIVKSGERKGDNASLCIVELVGRGETDVQRKRKKGAKKPRPKRRPATAAPAGERKAPAKAAAAAPQPEDTAVPAAEGTTAAQPKKAEAKKGKRPAARKPARKPAAAKGKKTTEDKPKRSSRSRKKSSE
jgi:large subunit ribosomal protein L17